MTERNETNHPVGTAWTQGLQDFLGDWKDEQSNDILLAITPSSQANEVAVTYENLSELGSGTRQGAYDSQQNLVEVLENGQTLFNLVPTGTENGLKILSKVSPSPEDDWETERFVEEEGGGDPTNPEG